MRENERKGKIEREDEIGIGIERQRKRERKRKLKLIRERRENLQKERTLPPLLGVFICAPVPIRGVRSPDSKPQFTTLTNIPLQSNPGLPLVRWVGPDWFHPAPDWLEQAGPGSDWRSPSRINIPCPDRAVHQVYDPWANRGPAPTPPESK